MKLNGQCAPGVFYYEACFPNPSHSCGYSKNSPSFSALVLNYVQKNCMQYSQSTFSRGRFASSITCVIVIPTYVFENHTGFLSTAINCELFS